MFESKLNSCHLSNHTNRIETFIAVFNQSDRTPQTACSVDLFYLQISESVLS